MGLWGLERTSWISRQRWCPGCSEAWNTIQDPKVEVIVKIPHSVREVFWVHNILNFNITDLKENLSFVVGSLCYVLEKFPRKSFDSCFAVRPWNLILSLVTYAFTFGNFTCFSLPVTFCSQNISSWGVFNKRLTQQELFLSKPSAYLWLRACIMPYVRLLLKIQRANL